MNVGMFNTSPTPFSFKPEDMERVYSMVETVMESPDPSTLFKSAQQGQLSHPSHPSLKESWEKLQAFGNIKQVFSVLEADDFMDPSQSDAHTSWGPGLGMNYSA